MRIELPTLEPRTLTDELDAILDEMPVADEYTDEEIEQLMAMVYPEEN